jgi:hypothetical protein
MRWKIIVANAGIVLLVGILAYALMSTSLTDLVSNTSTRKTAAAQAARSASARLALDAVQLERWLAERVRAANVRDVFAAGTAQARQDSASIQANKIRDDAVQAPSISGLVPTIVLVVDDQGVALGRNGSALMRGEKISSTYASLAQSLATGNPVSDLWINHQRQEQMFVSMAPVRSEQGTILGAVVIGIPLNDERLQRTSELTSGASLFFSVVNDNSLDIAARGGPQPNGDIQAELTGAKLLPAAQAAMRTHNVVTNDVRAGEWVSAAAPVDGFVSGQAVIIASLPTSLVASVSGFLAPLLGAILLGLVLVVVAGWMLGNYITQPISELEDGLLAVINGNQTLRFQLEHPEFGGLVFRINSLLNALMGVAEDNTDEQGRPSVSPDAHHFEEALSVDESSIANPQVDAGTIASLAAEPAEAYYSRIFRDYVSAKQKLGDPIDGLSYDGFMNRIRANEQEMSAKYGRAVRFIVELRGNAVVLNAVPIA